MTAPSCSHSRAEPHRDAHIESVPATFACGAATEPRTYQNKMVKCAEVGTRGKLAQGRGLLSSAPKRIAAASIIAALVSPPVLWQYNFSNFNEKARWALDFKGIAHIRRSLLPGGLRAMAFSRGGTLPVLDMDGERIVDSTRIIAALERRFPLPALYPEEPGERAAALELEDFFDEELGPHLRRALFHAVLPDADFASAFLTVGTGAVTQRLYRLCFPLVRAVMRADMRIDDAGAALGVRKIGAALDHIRAELRPSGYLVGEGFTVADLTAAALLYPLLLPPEAPYRLDRPIPPAAAEMRGSFAAHPAFTWAAGMYRRHRGTSAEVAGR